MTAAATWLLFVSLAITACSVIGKHTRGTTTDHIPVPTEDNEDES